MSTQDVSRWQAVQQLVRGYRDAQVLITAVELGIFEQLSEGPLEAAALAGRTGADPAALTRLLNAAVSLNLLEVNDGVYTSGPLARACLVPDAPFYMGRLLQREGAFYNRWGHLTEAVRTGRRPEENVRDEAVANWVRDFELALFDLSRVYGPSIAAALELPADRPLRVLDVGGGHGGYCMALADRYPNIRAKVFELPAAAAVARDLVENHGYADRIGVIEGDFQKESLGEGYDVVLLFGVLVSETPAGKVELLRKAHKALVPGGRIVVREFLLDADRTGPPPGPIFSLHMLLSTDAGDLAAADDMGAWVQAAGFGSLTTISLPDFPDSRVYSAVKRG